MKKNLVYIGNNLKRKDTNPTYMQALAAKLKSNGYTVRLASSKSNKLLRIVDMLTTVWKHGRRANYVLIDTYSTQNFYYAVVVGWLCRQLKTPYIPILHGGNLPNRLKRSPKLAASYFNGAHLNISPSAYLQQQFYTAGFTNVSCIPNAISTADFNFKNRPSLAPKILWVRSFSAIYNPLMAVQTLMELKKTFPNASLCMAGPEVDATLQDCHELSNTNKLNVLYKGKLTRQAWSELAKDYSIFINTANFDNTPLSVIEAMALGLPVVSTNVGGMPFLITHNIDGLLVPKGDYQKMAMAIQNLLTDSKLAKTLIKNAQVKAISLDWSKVLPLWDVVLK